MKNTWLEKCKKVDSLPKTKIEIKKGEYKITVTLEDCTEAESIETLRLLQPLMLDKSVPCITNLSFIQE